MMQDADTSITARFKQWRAARLTESRLTRLRQAIMAGAKMSRITSLARDAYYDPGVEKMRLKCIPPMLTVVLVQDADFYAWVHGEHTKRWLVCVGAIRASMPEQVHTI